MSLRKLIFSTELIEVVWVLYILYYSNAVKRIHWQEPKLVTILTMILMLWCIISDVVNLVRSFKTIDFNHKVRHILRIVFTAIIFVGTFINNIR